MKIELDKQKKIFLLQAIADGAIETDIVADWGRDNLESISETEIIERIIAIETSLDTGLNICQRRIELKKCPYNQLAKTFIQALDKECKTE